MAILFCLAVVRDRWPRQIPTLSAAAQELGVSRELAPRLRARFFDLVVELIAETNRPGPRVDDAGLPAAQKRLRIVEALLSVARAIIAAAGIAALAARRRDDLVVAVERLHAEHGISYEQVAVELGLSDRTLRRLRERHNAGEELTPRSRAPAHPHGKIPEPLAQAALSFASLHPNVPVAELHRRFVAEQAQLCAEHGHPNLACTTFARQSGRAHELAADKTPAPRRGRDAPENLPHRAFALMDTSDVNCFGFTFKLIPFMEAHSREIFAHQLCDHDRAHHVEQVLEQGQESSGGVLGLRIDRGTPYLAEITVAAAQDQGIDMRVARAHTPTDKAILERFFRTLKDALHPVFECIDLGEGPGELSWRQEVARRVATAVIAVYLRWGYPYIPQPYIDGRSPRERTEQAVAAAPDLIRAALDERVQHHEHAQTVARELHEAYGFRWSMTRWLKVVRSYTAGDLREAAHRFDQVLLRRCFTCDTRRTPNYFIAVIRDVARDRHERERAARNAQTRSEQRRLQDEAHLHALCEEDRRRQLEPEDAAVKAIQLARDAFANHGFGLSVAQSWLDAALQTIASRGAVAIDLAVVRLLETADAEQLRAWLGERVALVRPLRTSVCADLDL